MSDSRATLLHEELRAVMASVRAANLYVDQAIEITDAIDDERVQNPEAAAAVRLLNRRLDATRESLTKLRGHIADDVAAATRLERML